MNLACGFFGIFMRQCFTDQLETFHRHNGRQFLAIPADDDGLVRLRYVAKHRRVVVDRLRLVHAPSIACKSFRAHVPTSKFSDMAGNVQLTATL